MIAKARPISAHATHGRILVGAARGDSSTPCGASDMTAVRLQRSSRLIASSATNESASSTTADRGRLLVGELLERSTTTSTGAISGPVRHVAGDEDDRAVLADRAREGEREAGDQRRRDGRQDDAPERLQPVRAEARRGLLDVRVEVLDAPAGPCAPRTGSRRSQDQDDRRAASRRPGTRAAPDSGRASRVGRTGSSTPGRRPPSAARTASRPARRGAACRGTGSAPAPRPRRAPITRLISAAANERPTSASRPRWRARSTRRAANSSHESCGGLDRRPPRSGQAPAAHVEQRVSQAQPEAGQDSAIDVEHGVARLPLLRVGLADHFGL